MSGIGTRLNWKWQRICLTWLGGAGIHGGCSVGLEAHFRLILSQMNWNWLREILTCIKFILTQYGFRQTEQALSEHQLTAASFRNLSGLPTFARHHRPGAAHLLPRGFFYIFVRGRWVTTAEAAQKRFSNFERVFLPNRKPWSIPWECLLQICDCDYHVHVAW
jgi:hypothetical protein